MRISWRGVKDAIDSQIPQRLRRLLFWPWFGLFMVVCDILWGGYIKWPACVKEHVEGGVSTFSYRGWIVALPLAFILIGLIIQPRQRSKAAMWSPVILLAFVVPMVAQIATDRVVVDARHFRLSLGLWLWKSHANVHFADVLRVEVVKEFGGDTSDMFINLDCYMRSGEKHRINADGRLARTGLKKIVEVCRARGIVANDID